MRPNPVALGILTLCVAAIAFSLFLLRPVGVPEQSPPDQDGTPAETLEPHERLPGASALRSAEAALEPSTSPAAGEGGSPAARAEPLPPSGQLRLRIVDAATGRTLSPATLVLASEARIARLRDHAAVDGIHHVLLTPGHYQLWVGAPGYDPRQGLSFGVEAEVEGAIEEVALQRGRGTIEGKVIAPNETGALCIEIHGAGRNPCARCPADDSVCPDCGHGPSATMRTLDASRTFSVDALAAGEYHVVARREEGSILRMQKLQLDPAERRWVELSVHTMDLDLRVVNAEDQPMDGNWEEEGVEWSAPLRFSFLQEGVLVGTAEVAPSRSDHLLEDVPEDDGRPRTLTEQQLLVEGLQRPPAPDRQDRVRHAGDELWPRPYPPETDTRPLAARRTAPGSYSIDGVPRQAKLLVVGCGPYFSVPLALQLEDWDGEPLVVRIRERCGMGSEMLVKMKMHRCTDCHVLPGSLSQAR